MVSKYMDISYFIYITRYIPLFSYIYQTRNRRSQIETEDWKMEVQRLKIEA